MNTTRITRFVNRTVLKTKRNSPQLLFYSGIVGTVATTVLASRATLKAVPIVEQLHAERAELEVFRELNKVDDDAYSRDIARQYTQVTVDLGKLYLPVVVVGGISILALTKSHQQLTSRNTALTVAYTGLFKTLEGYRERVRNELGDQKDQEFLHGTVVESIEERDAKGKVKVHEITTLDKKSDAATTMMFDNSRKHWVKDPGYNQIFLQGIQDWANWRLNLKGFLFLSEVLDYMGEAPTKEGQILGWLKTDPITQELNYVDLGFSKHGEFFAGYDTDVMLEFNVTGAILDLLP